ITGLRKRAKAACDANCWRVTRYGRRGFGFRGDWPGTVPAAAFARCPADHCAGARRSTPCSACPGSSRSDGCSSPRPASCSSSFGTAKRFSENPVDRVSRTLWPPRFCNFPTKLIFLIYSFPCFYNRAEKLRERTTPPRANASMCVRHGLTIPPSTTHEHKNNASRPAPAGCLAPCRLRRQRVGQRQLSRVCRNRRLCLQNRRDRTAVHLSVGFELRRQLFQGLSPDLRRRN